MSDVVFLEGMQFYAFHGVNPEERTLGQAFVVDIELSQPPRPRDAADDVATTISYSAVFKRVQAVVEGEPRNLVETVAEAIADDLLGAFPSAEAVTVTLRKPAPPITGAILDAAGVRIHRTKEAN